MEDYENQNVKVDEDFIEVVSDGEEVTNEKEEDVE